MSIVYIYFLPTAISPPWLQSTQLILVNKRSQFYIFYTEVYFPAFKICKVKFLSQRQGMPIVTHLGLTQWLGL